MTPILFALAIVTVLLFVVVAGRPNEFTVTRSAKFAVPPEKIFPHVNTLRLWEAWSPWAKLDPAAKNSFSGPDAGAGAVMAWAGNCKVGIGQMTITDSQPGSIIRFRLDFQKPMESTSAAEFTFLRDGSGAVVTWSMTGKNNLSGKIFGLLFDCESMVGAQFEKGLASLKAVAEAA